MKAYNGHLIYEPSDLHIKIHRDGHCLICDRGLGICSVCGAGEAELGEPCKGRVTINHHNEPRCPICSTPLTYDEVDIGVGIQTENYRCGCCGWNPDQDDEQYCNYENGMEV